MIDKTKLFKKKGRVWHYYPFGHVIDDVYLRVKKDEKDAFCQALENEWKLIYALLSIILILGIYKLAFIFIPLLIYIPYFFINRVKIEKKYCDYKSYSKKRFFTAYFKIIYFFLDENDNHKFRVVLLGFIMLAISAFAMYVEKNTLWMIVMIILSLLFFSLFLLMCIKKYK